MLMAKIGVEYERGWTSELASYDVYAEWPASTYYDGDNYVGVLVLYTSEFDAVIEVIRSHEQVRSIDVVERTTEEGRTAATVIEHERGLEETPMRRLLERDYLPLRPTRLENGRQFYDVLFESHENVATVVDSLSEFGSVTTEHISQEFHHDIPPSAVEWQEFLGSITPAQRELYRTAIEKGYFEIPRECTLVELGDELGITKATACHQLRKVQQAFAAFAGKYFQPNLSG